jgi:putative membrane protein
MFPLGLTGDFLRLRGPYKDHDSRVTTRRRVSQTSDIMIRRVVSIAATPILCGLFWAGLSFAQDSATPKMDAGSNKMLRSADTTFAVKAAQGGLAEVKLGQLAAEKGSSPDVKAFGQQMVDDHSKANEQLKSVAQAENMTLPSEINPKQQAMYAKLQNSSGSEFDHMYVKAMVKDHEDDVKDFEKEANSGSDPQIKDFAAKTLPVLQGHLDKIKGIQSSMGSSK